YCRFGERFARLVCHELSNVSLDPDRDLFLGFNTNCLETIEFLRSSGIFTVVDQVDPGKAEEDLCVEEAERWPGWSKEPCRMPSEYWDRLRAEWEAADLVVVNSEWSAKALVKQGVPISKMEIVPLAFPLGASLPRERGGSQGKLKILWLGSLILRKGIQYLVE